jgi:hypothetical protein
VVLSNRRQVAIFRCRELFVRHPPGPSRDCLPCARSMLRGPDPTLAIGGQGAARHNTVNVWMPFKVRPRVNALQPVSTHQIANAYINTEAATAR